MSLRAWKLWEALCNALERDGVLDAYDLVILDTPPALGYLTINGLTAADILLVPLGASFLEFELTGRFFDMLHSTFQSIEAGENTAARALGRPEIRFEWDAVRAVITRFDGAQQAELAGLMQAYLGRTLSPFRQDFTALVGQAGEQVNGIYEADYRDFNRETYIRGRQTFDQTYAGFKRLLLASWRRDELARLRRRPREGDRLMARRRLAPLPEGFAPIRRDGADVPRAEHPAPRPSPPRRRRHRSPGSPPRPPARRRSRRWPRPCAAPARRAAWCSTCRSTPSPPTTSPATACPSRTRRWRRCARACARTASARRSRSRRSSGALPYGLISGWRRLTALQALHAETGEARFATVQALVRRPETAADAYVTMVEENEIRARPQPLRARPRRRPRHRARRLPQREGGAARALRHRQPRQALAHPRLPRHLPRARRQPALPGGAARAARPPPGREGARGQGAAIAAAIARADPATPEAEAAALEALLAPARPPRPGRCRSCPASSSRRRSAAVP